METKGLVHGSCFRLVSTRYESLVVALWPYEHIGDCILVLQRTATESGDKDRWPWRKRESTQRVRHVD